VASAAWLGTESSFILEGEVVSSKVKNRSLRAIDIGIGQLTRARFNANVCNPTVSTPDVTCSTITMSLPTAARVFACRRRQLA
jgi:hypothetical protein